MDSRAGTNIDVQREQPRNEYTFNVYKLRHVHCRPQKGKLFRQHHLPIQMNRADVWKLRSLCGSRQHAIDKFRLL